MNHNKSVLNIEGLNLSIGNNQILKDISMSFYRKKVTAIMGPSGCGKTTLIRSINRLSDLVPDLTMTGKKCRKIC